MMPSRPTSTTASGTAIGGRGRVRNGGVAATAAAPGAVLAGVMARATGLGCAYNPNRDQNKAAVVQISADAKFMATPNAVIHDRPGAIGADESDRVSIEMGIAGNPFGLEPWPSASAPAPGLDLGCSTAPTGDTVVSEVSPCGAPSTGRACRACEGGGLTPC